MAAFVAGFACLAPFALGGTTASALTTGGGGIGVPEIPKVSDAICLTHCTGIRSVSVGGTIQITGRHMESVKYVSFRANRKGVRVEPNSTTDTRVEATVPEGASTGSVRVIGIAGGVSNPSPQPLTISKQTFGRTGRLVVTDARTSPRRAFQFGLRRPVLSFVVNGSSPRLNLRVDIVNSKGDVVHSRFLNRVAAGTAQKVGWNGLLPGGRSAANGAYRFVIRGNDGTTASLSSSLKRERRKAARSSKKRRGVTAPFSFRMFGFAFPVRARHSFGDGLGAGRGHQGQDVMARCGTPLYAARAGVVTHNTFQSAAGNYIVIRTRNNGGKSHMYMHMPKRSPLRVGSRVKTGQKIGWVGSTGRSTACHLHFEIWAGEPWTSQLLDPTGPLRRWDSYS